MRYRLKAGSPEFRLVTGSHKGHVLKHGEVYDSVPREQAHFFEPVDVVPEAAEAAAADEQPRGIRRRKPAAAEGGE